MIITSAGHDRDLPSQLKANGENTRRMLENSSQPSLQVGCRCNNKSIDNLCIVLSVMTSIEANRSLGTHSTFNNFNTMMIPELHTLLRLLPNSGVHLFHNIPTIVSVTVPLQTSATRNSNHQRRSMISCTSSCGSILHHLFNLNMLYSFLPLLLVRPSNARLATVDWNTVGSR
jgi:hypothetical protein